MTNKPSIHKFIKKIASIFSISFIFLLFSCEGFFTDNNLDQKIKAAIDYANAPSSSFWITADATSGTITPVGKISYKPTDYQNIKFKLKPEYEFIRWNFRYEEIQSGEKYTREITNQNWWKDFIDIVNEEISEPSTTGEITYTLQIQFKKPEENMLIEPVCALKPVLKSWSGQLGEIQSRNGSLSFVFNSRLDLDKSIYFSDTELNECAIDEETGEVVQITPLFNGQNPSRVYGYVKNGETYFKNIEIKYKNRSINSSYCDFRWNNDTNTLIIASDPNHNFDIVGDFADIEILFKDGIKSEGQASMKEAKAFVNINKYSDDRSVINTVTNTAKNPETVTPVAQTLYLQEQKTLTFAESENIQFLYWEVTSNSAYPDSIDKVYTEVDEENPRKLNYWGKQKIDSAEEVTISAVYEFRPKILSYTPGANTVAPKDSDIQINFDEEINLASFISAYKITCGGDLVNDYFDEPVLSADRKSVIIAAKLNNRLLIDSNKQVTVTVPASVYYTKTESDGETYQITLGQEKQLAYTVKPETRDKAYIQFNIDATQVTIDNFNTANVKTYSIGQTQTIVCNENSGYQFFGWVKNNDANNAIEVIKVDDSTYTFKINQACGLETAPIQINAISKERLSATLTSPLMDSNGVSKDNDIIIDFNHRPTLADCKEYISILYNNINLIDSSFLTDNWDELEETTVSGKTVYRLTIHANPQERLEISNISNIEVRIDEGLSYTDGQYKVYYKPKGDTFKYKINNSTKDKAFVQFEIENGHGTVKSGGSNFIITSTKTYNIGDEVTLTFEEGTNYQFFGWTKTGDENDKIQLVKSDVNNKIYTFRFTDQAGSTDSPVRIAAKTIERLRVNTVTPSNTDEGVAKDTGINIYFKQKPVLELCIQKIAISCSGIGNVKSCFPTTGWRLSDTPTSDGYCLSILADPLNPININALSTITVSFDSNLYYAPGTSTEGLPDLVYYGGEGFSYSYKIKNETNTKANVTLNVPAGQGSVNNSTTSIENDYSIGKRIKISFEPSADYEFLYWTVSPAGVLEFDDEDDKYLSSTYLNVKAGTSTDQTITVTPVCADKLKLQTVKVNNADYIATDTYPKDSEIVLTFNKPIPSGLLLSDYITLSCGDITGVYDYYTVTSSGSSITLSPRTRLGITSAQNLVLTVKNNLYYRYTDAADTSLTRNITLSENYTKTIKLTTETVEKAVVQVTNENTSAGTIKDSVTGNNFATTATTYSKDKTFTLNYDLNSAYEFINWTVTGTSSNVQLSSTTSPTTTVTIIGSASGTTTIEAVVAEKLKVNSVTVNGEAYSTAETYPKDSVIVLTFNKPIPTDILLSRYISLTCNNIPGVYDKYNVAVSGSTITFTPNSRLDIPSTKNLVLSVDSSLYYKYSATKNITLAENYSKSIQLTPETVEKATVLVTNTNTSAGTIKDSVTGNNFATTATTYSKDQTFTLNYDLNSAYEFINWTVTSSSGSTAANNVRLSSTTSPTTTVTIIGSATGTATIKANVAPKLALESMTVNGSTFSDTATTKYPKDSVIVLNFNKSIPTGLTLTEYITLSCGNITGVSDYYTITSSGTTAITLTPKTRLGITADETLNLTIKNSLYYKYSTTKNITLASNVTKAIPLDTTTVQKATVKVTNGNTSAGTIKDDSTGNNFTTSAVDYSKDQTFKLNYALNSGYEFINWTVTESATGAASNVQLSNENSPTTTVTIKDSASGTATIKAIAVEKLKVSSMTVNGETYSASGEYPKDSVIVLNFNKTLPSGSGFILTDYISLSCGDISNVESYYTITSSDSTITLTPKTRLNITSKQNLVLTVKKSLYYSNTTISPARDITLTEAYSKTIKLKPETAKKANIQIINGTTEWGTIKKDSDNSSFTESSVNYNIEDSIDIKFVPNDGYEFVCWEVTNGPAGNVSFSDIYSNPVTITVENSATGTTKIQPFCVEKLKVDKILINNTEYSSTDLATAVFSKDSSIAIKFNYPLNKTNDTEAGQYVQSKARLKYNEEKITSVLAADGYFDTRLSTDKKQVSFWPWTGKYIDVKDSGKIIVSFDKDYECVVSGTTTAGTSYTKAVTLGEEFNKAINVNYKTKKKIKIKTTYPTGYTSRHGEITFDPPADEDGYHYMGQDILVYYKASDFDYVSGWTVTEPTNIKTSGTDNLVYDWRRVRNDNQARMILNVKKATPQNSSDTVFEFTLTPSLQGMMKVVSISPTPGAYQKNTGTMIYSESVPCDTPIVLTYTDTVKVATSTTDTTDSSAYVKKLVKIYYKKSNGAEVDITEIFRHNDFSYTNNQGWPKESQVRYASNSNSFVIQPHEDIQEIFENGEFEKTIYIQFNFVSCTTSGISFYGLASDLRNYEDPSVSTNYQKPIISYKINRNISSSRPIIASSDVKLTSSIASSSGNMSEGLLGIRLDIENYAQNASRNGEVNYNIVFNGMGNWGGTYKSYEYEIEMIKYGRSVKSGSSNRVTIIYNDRTTHTKSGTVNCDGTSGYMRINGTLNLDSFFADKDLIQINFIFHDINGGTAKKTYSVYYDENGEGYYEW